ncbi:transposase [Streptomyces sp. NPDC057910]|uniref:transposase n=1 Tax=Streptomyces sp. NPDC057910 TaxID=3346278 RepID=UPI0036E47198
MLIQNDTRTVAGGREVVKRREKQDDGGDGLPPGETRTASPYNIRARWSAKRDTFWLGCKLHISETCSRPAPDTDPTAAPERPNLITSVTTTTATLPDTKALEAVHTSLDTRGLLPPEHYLDSGYPNAELIVSSLEQHGVALTTPVLHYQSRQAKARNRFAAHDFTIDWEAEKATCPAGKTSTTWNPVIQNGTPKTVVSFAAADCGPCPLKEQCTSARSNRRQLSIHPQQMFEALRAARTEQQTEDLKADYALRAGIEGTVRQATHRTGARRTPYRGLAKTQYREV